MIISVQSCIIPGGRIHLEILDQTAAVIIAIGLYIVLPSAIIWGWVRWLRSPKARTISSILSLAGFSLASASALFAVCTVVYAQLFGGFPFYDPRLLRIYRWGALISFSSILVSIGGAWRPGVLRWLAPAYSIGVLLFWFVTALGE